MPPTTNSAPQGQNQGQNRQGGQNQNRRPRNDMPKEEKEFDERVVHIDRVARVVKGGRRFRFRALVVIGDHKGKVGIGTAKGADVTAAVSKAVDVAKKNLVMIPIYKETIPHEAEAQKNEHEEHLSAEGLLAAHGCDGPVLLAAAD